MKWTIGGNVDSWCTRCKLILAHTIEAVADNKIKRVHCNTCKGKHAFKANEPGTKTVSTTRAAPKEKRVKAFGGTIKAGDYDRMMTGRDMRSAKGYSVKDKYGAGDVVSHTLFGMGIVTTDKGFNKIEVLFQVGPKVLVHGR